MEDSLIGSEPQKVNSDFYKKLQQQIVQKENMIKLLQLKVKNLEEGAGTLPADLGRGSGENGAGSQRRIRELERAERSLQEENDTLARRAAKDEEAIQDLEQRLALASEELGRKNEELTRVSALLPGTEDRKYDKLWDQIGSLETKVAQKEQEVSRLRAELAEVRPPEATLQELRELKQEAEQLRSSKLRLEELIAQLKEKGPQDALLGDELARRDEQVRHAEQDRARLADEVERLRRRLEEVRTQAGDAAPAGSFQLVSALITLFQRLTELRERSIPSEEFSPIEACLEEISRQIGLQRIKCVGRQVDSELHQITEVVYSTEHPHDTIIREASHGYTAAGSVVKLAEVVVNRNPYWCKRCERVAAEGSRYCNFCGEKVAGRESPDLQVLDPSLATRSFLELAAAREEEGDHPAAEKAYHHVVEIDSGNARALWGLVRVREAQGRYDEAIEELGRLSRVSASGAELERCRRRLETKREIVSRLQQL